jgi:predicted O-methyltransferase YrrM
MITIEAIRDSNVILETYTQMLAALRGAVPGDGLILEFGVYKGASINVLAKDHPKCTIHGFDSFRGLPGEWTRGNGETWAAGHFNVNGQLPEVLPNVKLYPGWFKETIPPFLAANAGPIRFINIDCDIYRSAWDVLALCNSRINPGAVIYFDEICDWGGSPTRYPGWADHEIKALVNWCTEFKRDVAPLSRNGSYGAAVTVRI